MHVTELEFDPKLILGPADQLVRDGMDANLGPRSPGLHLSQVYYDIEETVDGPRDSNMSEKELAVYRAGGFLWEHAFNLALTQSLVTDDCIRPGEFKCDGIIGSPDLIEQSTWTVIDTKMTWKSSNKLDNLEKNFWSWLIQLKGYCRMVDSLQARLIVFCVNGNYAPPRPTCRCLNLTFTCREIQDNWVMITGHARKRGWI